MRIAKGSMNGSVEGLSESKQRSSYVDGNDM
jgi:hypothetical protein